MEFIDSPQQKANKLSDGAVDDTLIKDANHLNDNLHRDGYGLPDSSKDKRNSNKLGLDNFPAKDAKDTGIKSKSFPNGDILLAMAEPQDPAPPLPMVSKTEGDILADLRQKIEANPTKVNNIINSFVDTTYREVEKAMRSQNLNGTLNLAKDLHTLENIDAVSNGSLLTPEMRLASSIYKLVGLDQEGFVRELRKRVNTDSAKLESADNKRLNQFIYNNLKDRFAPPVDEKSYEVVGRQLNVTTEEAKQLHNRYLIAATSLGLLRPGEKPVRALVSTPPQQVKADLPASADVIIGTPLDLSKIPPVTATPPEKPVAPADMPVAKTEPAKATPANPKEPEKALKKDKDLVDKERDDFEKTQRNLLIVAGSLAAVLVGYGGRQIYTYIREGNRAAVENRRRASAANANVQSGEHSTTSETQGSNSGSGEHLLPEIDPFTMTGSETVNSRPLGASDSGLFLNLPTNEGEQPSVAVSDTVQPAESAIRNGKEFEQVKKALQQELRMIPTQNSEERAKLAKLTLDVAGAGRKAANSGDYSPVIELINREHPTFFEKFGGGRGAGAAGALVLFGLSLDYLKDKQASNESPPRIPKTVSVVGKK